MRTTNALTVIISPRALTVVKDVYSALVTELLSTKTQLSANSNIRVAEADVLRARRAIALPHVKGNDTAAHDIVYLTAIFASYIVPYRAPTHTVLSPAHTKTKCICQ